MRRIIVALVALTAATAFADYVKPYVRKDGTYVPGHYRSSPDKSLYVQQLQHPGEHEPLYRPARDREPL